MSPWSSSCLPLVSVTEPFWNHRLGHVHSAMQQAVLTWSNKKPRRVSLDCVLAKVLIDWHAAGNAAGPSGRFITIFGKRRFRPLMLPKSINIRGSLSKSGMRYLLNQRFRHPFSLQKDYEQREESRSQCSPRN